MIVVATYIDGVLSLFQRDDDTGALHQTGRLLVGDADAERVATLAADLATLSQNGHQPAPKSKPKAQPRPEPEPSAKRHRRALRMPSREEVAERERRIVQYLAEHPGSTNDDIAGAPQIAPMFSHTAQPSNSVYQVMLKLQRTGQVTGVLRPSGKGTAPMLWTLHPPPEPELPPSNDDV